MPAATISNDAIRDALRRSVTGLPGWADPDSAPSVAYESWLQALLPRVAQSGMTDVPGQIFQFDVFASGAMIAIASFATIAEAVDFARDRARRHHDPQMRCLVFQSLPDGRGVVYNTDTVVIYLHEPDED
jgi:hypothetical protein